MQKHGIIPENDMQKHGTIPEKPCFIIFYRYLCNCNIQNINK